MTYWTARHIEACELLAKHLRAAKAAHASAMMAMKIAKACNDQAFARKAASHISMRSLHMSSARHQANILKGNR